MIKEGLTGVVCSVGDGGKITKAHCFEGSDYHNKMRDNGSINGTTIVYISAFYLKEVFYSGLGKSGFEVRLVEKYRVK